MSNSTNPVKAIRDYCIDCSGGSREEVKLCVIPECPLYPFRQGHNPFRRKREYTEEQKAEMAEKLRNLRGK